MPPPRRCLLPLAICAGTCTLLMGVTASGAAAPHRRGHPLPSLCRLGQAVDTYEPTLEPMLHTLGVLTMFAAIGASRPLLREVTAASVRTED